MKPRDYRFVQCPIASLPRRIEHRLVRTLERDQRWEAALGWSRLVERTARRRTQISVILICRRWHLVGMAILSITSLGPSTWSRSDGRLWRWLDRLFSLRVGVIDIPAMNDCGLFLFDERARADLPEICRRCFSELQRREHLQVLFVNSVSGTALEDALRALSFVCVAVNYRAHLDNPFSSYDDYLSRQSRKKRRFIYGIDRTFARGNISLEMVDREDVVDQVAGRLTELHRNAISGKKRSFYPLTLGEGFWSQFIRQKALRPLVAICRREGRLVGFITYMRSKNHFLIKTAGWDGAENLEYKIFQKMVYAGIQHGIDGGYQTLDLGVTRSTFKDRYLRCSFTEFHYWLNGWGKAWPIALFLRAVSRLRAAIGLDQKKVEVATP